MMQARTLRSLFVHLQEFQSLFTAHGVDTIVGPDGDRYNLFDLQNLFEKRFTLPEVQATAVEMWCYDDLENVYIAGALGVNDIDQVDRDATEGLRTLCEIYNGCPYVEDEEERIELLLEHIGDGTFLGEENGSAFVWNMPAAGSPG